MIQNGDHMLWVLSKQCRNAFHNLSRKNMEDYCVIEMMFYYRKQFKINYFTSCKGYG